MVPARYCATIELVAFKLRLLLRLALLVLEVISLFTALVATYPELPLEKVKAVPPLLSWSLIEASLAVRSKRLFPVLTFRLSPELKREDCKIVLLPEVMFRSLPEIIVEEMLDISVMFVDPLSFARSDLSL